MSRSDVRSYLQPGGRRSRDATETLTEKLESRIQGLMDTLGPGRPLPESALVSTPAGTARLAGGGVVSRMETRHRAHCGAPSHSPVLRYSSIDAAALRPAPMARITVAPPVTMSPPAKTPFFEVRRVSGSAAM